MKFKFLGNFCINNCAKKNGNKYFTCTRKGGGEDSCSPNSNQTATGQETCQGPCKNHGYNYFWCRTRNSWDYCGPTVGLMGKYWQLRLTSNKTFQKYMLRLYQMASVLEVGMVTTVILTVLIYTSLNDNNQYKA